MSETYFWSLLNLKPGATVDQIKQAYHQLAKQNHPDFYLEGKKAFQEMKMMTLNEAYHHLLLSADHSMADQPRKNSSVKSEAEESPENQKALSFHKDPAYAYYKQGFVCFSNAIFGIEALYQSFSHATQRSYKPRHEAYQKFRKSLVFLHRANLYFHRVVTEFPVSIWSRDADMKLRRIERFNRLYRKIIHNLI